MLARCSAAVGGSGMNSSRRLADQVAVVVDPGAELADEIGVVVGDLEAACRELRAVGEPRRQIKDRRVQ